MVESGEDTQDSGLAGKVRLLGEAPELLREKAVTCSDFMSPGFRPCWPQPHASLTAAL